MKQRLLAFLVQELGFTTFAIEASWPEARRLDAYVRTGRGDPASLLGELHEWPFDTRELLDLVRWLRAHNAGSASPVGFAGVDVQLPNLAIDDVLAYVQGVDAPAAAHFAALYAPFRPYTVQQLGFGRTTYGAEAPSVKARCRAGVRRAYADLEGRRAAYGAAASPQAFAQALQDARVVGQAEEVWAYGAAPEADVARDRAMAANATWLLARAGPATKLALWAHNEHVGTLPYAPGIPSLGMHLRDGYGAALVVCGFAFAEGAFNVYAQGSGVTVQRVPPPPPDSYAAAFQRAGLPRLVLDLRRLPDDPARTGWLVGPRRLRSIGAVYNPTTPDAYFDDVSLPRKFDAVIFFQRTSPTTQLVPWSCPGLATAGECYGKPGPGWQARRGRP